MFIKRVCSIEKCPLAVIDENQTMCTAHCKFYNLPEGVIPIASHKGLSGQAEYRTWQAMRQRCYNPKSNAYANYGGRGIKICDRWLGKAGFTFFLADMGRKPSEYYSIDRIDNDGNYEPSNCRWVTPLEQANNKRTKNKHIGVVFDKYSGLWKASMVVNNMTMMQAYFKDKNDAITARKLAESAWLSEHTDY